MVPTAAVFDEAIAQLASLPGDTSFYQHSNEKSSCLKRCLVANNTDGLFLLSTEVLCTIFQLQLWGG